MGLIRIIGSIGALTILPWIVGSIYAPLKKDGARGLFLWISGQVTLWAGFLMISVPMILRSMIFSQVMRAYLVFCGVMSVIALIFFFVRGGVSAWKKDRQGENRFSFSRLSGMAQGLWIILAVIMLLQILCVFFLAYEDGDDSYYVSITTFSRDMDSMYMKIPYTGKETELDMRHALSPFPIWVAIISKLSGLSGAATAHVVMRLWILLMAYGLYYLLGESLWKGKDGGHDWDIPLFMCFCALLLCFGGYSIYSAENFLIVRAGQGKAVLANVVIPLLFYELVLLTGKLERQEKLPASFWILLSATMAAGCLCSTQGSLLLCILLGIAVCCTAFIYKRIRIFAGMFLAMIVPAVVAALYVGLYVP